MGLPVCFVTKAAYGSAFKAQYVAPPCKTTVTCEVKPYSFESENYTEVYFPEDGNVSDQDRQTLLGLSISEPYEYPGGSFAIILPPGAEISQDGNQTTIALPDCQ